MGSAAESTTSASGRACCSTSAWTRLAAQITTSASAMARAARMVSRSAAPGPAPTKVARPVRPAPLPRSVLTAGLLSPRSGGAISVDR
ncbi:hypothetical protein ACFQXA_15415 [Nocardiopsis composta]